MDCKTFELYMDALIDNELSIKDCLEIINHAESCSSCKDKWDLSEEARSKFKHFISSIKASNELRVKICNSISQIENKSFYPRLALLAASFAFFVGAGLFFNTAFLKTPSLSDLHNKASSQIVSSDIELLSQHLGIDIKKPHLAGFEQANFKPYSAAKFVKPFNKSIKLIALKNDQGHKISLCFLPEDYKVANSLKTEINGITFHYGRSNDNHFALWRQNGKSIALVSETLTPVEMIDLAMTLMPEA